MPGISIKDQDIRELYKSTVDMPMYQDKKKETATG
jgi:hypothetical protein